MEDKKFKELVCLLGLSISKFIYSYFEKKAEELTKPQMFRRGNYDYSNDETNF